MRNQSLLVFCLLMLLGGCQISTPQPQAKPYSEARQTLSDRERSELYQAILTAELAQGKDDLETALTHYLYALTILPDAKIASEAIILAQKTKDPAALIQASNAWLQLEPNNSKAIESNILGQLMQFDLSQDLREESLSAALAGTRKLITLSANEADAYRELSGLNRIYLQSSTLSLWQQLVRELSDSPLPWTLLADAYYKAAEITRQESYLQKAEPAVTAAIRKNDSFQPAIELNVNLMRQQNKTAQILPFLETLLIDNPDNTAALEVLSHEYYRHKAFDKAIAIAERLTALNPDDITSQYLLAASYYGKGDFKKSHRYFLSLVTEDYRPELSFYYCGDTAERIESWSQAIACYKNVPEGDYWYAAQQRLSFILVNQGREQEALDRLEQFALNAQPQQAEQAIVLRGDLLLRLNQTLQALDWLTRFIDQQLQSLQVPLKHFEAIQQTNPQDDWREYADTIAKRINVKLQPRWYRQLAAKITETKGAESAIKFLDHAIEQHRQDVELRYTRALLREQTGELQKLESELRETYLLAPDNPHVQNALGYTLADHNKELDFAQHLIEQAYQRLPQSGAVLDSMGWVLFRQGELDQAEQWLRKALALEPAPEVLAHLLEVLANNNKTEEAKSLARQFWEEFQDSSDLKQVIEAYQLLQPNP